MVICVASGKGGTGKTTVATNLAAVLGENAQYLDCDVEEPNGHIFLKPQYEHREKVYVPVPQVDLNKCDFCKKCAEFCQFNALAVLGQNVLVFPELCHSCGGCMLVCPQEAISERGREVGVCEKGRALLGVEFVHGHLRIGEAQAVPLIERVKKEIKPNKTAIVDAPPGTSCPVIATLKGVDFVVLVTEPTPFGLHDLKLAVGVARILNLPMGVVVNRADLGDRKVFEYCEKEGIPILMTIPFSRDIAECYAKGKLIIGEEKWRDEFLKLFQKIKEIVGG